MYNRNLNIMIQKANNKDIGSKKNFVSGLIFYCYANPSMIIYFHLKALTLSYEGHKKLITCFSGTPHVIFGISAS